MKGSFLTAEWRDLAMLNYEVDPALLKRFVPVGTELDFFEGKTYLSMVGFMFLKTRLLGIPVPFHRNFEEVNLRFYVRRKAAEGWRRGVTFIRELVPMPAIALVARAVYGEPYLALPMRHRIDRTNGVSVCYSWKRRGNWESVEASAPGPALEIADGSLEEFIMEHYWGYTPQRRGFSEYEVRHPRWRGRVADSCRFSADVATLYGPEFADTLSRQPASAFIAEGSEIAVMKKQG